MLKTITPILRVAASVRGLTTTLLQACATVKRPPANYMRSPNDYNSQQRCSWDRNSVTFHEAVGVAKKSLPPEIFLTSDIVEIVKFDFPRVSVRKLFRVKFPAETVDWRYESRAFWKCLHGLMLGSIWPRVYNYKWSVASFGGRGVNEVWCASPHIWFGWICYDYNFDCNYTGGPGSQTVFLQRTRPVGNRIMSIYLFFFFQFNTQRMYIPECINTQRMYIPECINTQRMYILEFILETLYFYCNLVWLHRCYFSLLSVYFA